MRRGRFRRLGMWESLPPFNGGKRRLARRIHGGRHFAGAGVRFADFVRFVAIVKVYAAIRGRVGFEPAADNYLVAWPSVPRIAEDAGLHRATVIATTEWLDDRDYFIRLRRPNRSSEYLMIVRRAWFREVAAREGRDAAIHALWMWRLEAASESRRQQARQAGERRTGQARPSGWKSPGDDLPADGGSPVDDLGGRPGTTSGVACGRPRTEVKVNCVTSNRGSSDAEPARALAEHYEKSPATGIDEKAINALLRPGLRKVPGDGRLTDAEREKRIAKMRRQMEDWK